MRAFVLGCALLCGGVQGLVPAALAHSGHGDAFVPNGVVGQVKASPEQDQLLGITTAPPQSDTDGLLTVPSVAIVDAAGKPLVFVRSGSTYDPVFVRLGPATGDRTVVLEGVSADEQVVVSGALSLFAESQKKDRVPVEQGKTALSGREQGQAAEPAQHTATPWRRPAGIGVAVVVLIGAVLGLRSRGSGSKDS
jgi:membrane fusion protein, cation efflux system